MSARPVDVIALMKMKPEHPEVDVIGHDLILVGKSKSASSPVPIYWGGSSVKSPHGKSDRIERQGKDNVSAALSTLGMWESGTARLLGREERIRSGPDKTQAENTVGAPLRVGFVSDRLKQIS